MRYQRDMSEKARKRDLIDILHGGLDYIYTWMRPLENNSISRDSFAQKKTECWWASLPENKQITRIF